MKIRNKLNQLILFLGFLSIAILYSPSIDAQKSTRTDGLFGEYTVETLGNGEKILEFSPVAENVAKLICENFNDVFLETQRANMRGAYVQLANAMLNILNQVRPTTLIFDGVTYKFDPQERVFLIEGSPESQFATAFSWIENPFFKSNEQMFNAEDPEIEAWRENLHQRMENEATRAAQKRARECGGMSNYEYQMYFEQMKNEIGQQLLRDYAIQNLQEKGLPTEEYRILAEFSRLNFLYSRGTKGSGSLFKVIVRGNVKLCCFCFQDRGLQEMDVSESDLQVLHSEGGISICHNTNLQRFVCGRNEILINPNLKMDIGCSFTFNFKNQPGNKVITLYEKYPGKFANDLKKCLKKYITEIIPTYKSFKSAASTADAFGETLAGCGCSIM